MTTTQYLDSSLTRQDGPFAGEMLKAEGALCPDAQRRNAWPAHDGIADTFFSIPAFVYVGRTRVYGYVTVETLSGFTTPMPDDLPTVKFVPYKYRKHHSLVEWDRKKVEAALTERKDIRWWDTGVGMVGGDVVGKESVPVLHFLISIEEDRDPMSLTYDEICKWLYNNPEVS